MLLVAGCGSSPDPVTSFHEGLEADPPPGQSSALSDAVLADLEAHGAANFRRTWSISSDNTLDDGWIVQTPPLSTWGQPASAFSVAATCTSADCDPDFELQRCASDADCTKGGHCAAVAATVRAPGASAQHLCVGHSDELVDDFYQLVVSAQRFVDVTSLTPPDGRFQAALRNAMTFLGNSGRRVTVRLLFGDYPIQDAVNSKTVVKDLTRDVPRSAPLVVFVGNYRSSDVPPSWNHSKMVAVDGQRALVGGHNLWTQHYLDIQPVHDLSLRLSGGAAGDVHRFANAQWQYTCANMSVLTWLTWSVWSNSVRHGVVADECAPQYQAADVPGSGATTVIAMGRLAEIDPTHASNQSDTAIHALVAAAQHTIRLSLQDLGPPAVPGVMVPLGNWPDDLFAKLGDALLRGVDVYIVLSEAGAKAGGLPAIDAQYANGWTQLQVAQKIRDATAARVPAGGPTGAALRALLCAHLHVAPLRFSDDGVWPGGVPPANHAKLVFVDDQAFYIGSQNQYDANLTEFGYVVDDTRAARQLYREYWAQVWRYSSRAAVTGSEAASCGL